MTHHQPGGFLHNLTRIRPARSGRASSWDQSGRNQDFWLIPPQESIILANVEGPGCLTHLWMTQFCRRSHGPYWETDDPFYYRKVLLKIYWDDQETPGVLAPLGDFFCVGHSLPGNFASLPFTVSSRPGEPPRFGANAALNCYLPMPFNRRARVVVENQNDIPYGQYFYIDYELYREPLDEDVAYFHAHWRRENPLQGWGPQLQVNSPETNVVNLSAENNYLILEAEGRGHYVGCNLSVTNFQGNWWGEGDEMIFIDGDTWPPSLHGTGSEDYFNQAWGMQNNAFPMNGSALHESLMPGYQVSYRFHLADPVHFSERIRVTMEHGHANHLSDDWSSTAYWYQALPSPRLDILPVDERLPVVLPSAAGGTLPQPRPQATDGLTEEMHASIARMEARYASRQEQQAQELQQEAERTRRASQGNVEQARQIRASFAQRPAGSGDSD